MREVNPVLAVRSIAESMKWYQESLGFTEWFRWENQGELAAGAVEHGSVRFILTRARNLSPEQLAVRGTGVEFYIGVGDADIDAYYNEVKGKARVVDPIADQPWGDRTFTVADPDGYRITFYKEKAQ